MNLHYIKLLTEDFREYIEDCIYISELNLEYNKLIAYNWK